MERARPTTLADASADAAVTDSASPRVAHAGTEDRCSTLDLDDRFSLASRIGVLYRRAREMGTTFVSVSRESVRNNPGFWMQDSMLELWLRLLALHLPEPTDGGEHSATPNIRNQWLLASRGYFTGCVPHGLADACLLKDGPAAIRSAIDSLLSALQRADVDLAPATLNLLGIEGHFTRPIERSWLIDIGNAFLDLLDGKVTCVASSTEIMPGSKPYHRKAASG